MNIQVSVDYFIILCRHNILLSVTVYLFISNLINLVNWYIMDNCLDYAYKCNLAKTLLIFITLVYLIII